MHFIQLLARFLRRRWLHSCQLRRLVRNLIALWSFGRGVNLSEYEKNYKPKHESKNGPNSLGETPAAIVIHVFVFCCRVSFWVLLFLRWRWSIDPCLYI